MAQLSLTTRCADDRCYLTSRTRTTSSSARYRANRPKVALAIYHLTTYNDGMHCMNESTVISRIKRIDLLRIFGRFPHPPLSSCSPTTESARLFSDVAMHDSIPLQRSLDPYIALCTSYIPPLLSVPTLPLHTLIGMTSTLKS